MTPRSKIAVLTAAAAAIVGATLLRRPAPVLLWNASASVPVGLYAVRPAGGVAVGDLVVVQPPGPLADLMARRRYLPRGLPLIKPIADRAGQTVCRVGAVIIVDGRATATALRRDHAGRPLPVWSGCQTIGQDQVFLLNPTAPASFDGRYFGLLPRRTIVGRATPIWTPHPR